jgi:hypothetical protein
MTTQAQLHFTEIQPEPILDDHSPGAEHIRYGYEGGRALKDDRGNYHIFCAEVSSPPVAVGTHLAHWQSADGQHFERVSTLFQSSGDRFTNVSRLFPCRQSPQESSGWPVAQHC